MNRAPNQFRGLKSNGTLMPVALLSAAFVFAYYKSIALMINVWSTRPESSHGFLVPFAALYFAYTDRDKLKGIQVKPALWTGGLLLLLSSFFLRLGQSSGTYILELFSLICVIYSLFILTLGWKFCRSAWLPLSYLVFMVPFLDIGNEKMHWPFQLLTARMAYTVLSAMNITVRRVVNVLQFPDFSLVVAPACSGISYLLSIIAIAIPVSYYVFRQRGFKVFFLISALVIGIVANWLRVVLIALWSLSTGKVSHGPMHIFQGVFVSVIGFIGLFALAFVMSRLERKPEDEKKQRVGAVAGKKAGNWRLATFIAVFMILLFGVYEQVTKIRDASAMAGINTLPYSLPGWTGKDVQLPDSRALNDLDPDSYIMRRYTGPGGEIFLYLGYYEAQRYKRKLVSYRLEDLYENATGSNLGSRRVMKTVLKIKGKSYLALFWLEAGGRTVTNRYEAILLSALQGLVHEKNSSAIIILFSPERPNTDIGGQLDDIESFAAQMGPGFQKIP
ncbi:MAG: EpsI family protein [Nitrospiraceae bacterium]|nr:EpsI family protein [Nitrospiraceae bacterium]